MLAKIGLAVMISVLIHSWTSVWRYGKEREIELEVGTFLDKFLGRGRRWGEDYVAVMDLWNTDSEELYDYEDVALATQCSVNNLHHLPELVARWDGPASVAIFAPQTEAIRAIIGTHWLRACFPKTFSRTRFHLVYPVKLSPRSNDDFLDSPELKPPQTRDTEDLSYCTTAMEALRSLKRDNYVLNGVPYPHNTLRNVAMFSVKTKFTFVLDVDTFPGINVRNEFLSFVRMSDTFDNYDRTKVAFVVPAFEMKYGMPIPRTKSELIAEYKREYIRPFHSETCKNCHEPTRFSDWLAIPENSDLAVAYEVEWKESWEPFYVAEASLPPYDDRFKQYGFDRISQVCELFIAGYRFFVLNNAFVVHDGFKRPHEFHSTKNLENRKNYKIYTEQFMPDLAQKYPDSKRTCADEGKRRGIAQAKFRPHLKMAAETNLKDL